MRDAEDRGAEIACFFRFVLVIASHFGYAVHFVVGMQGGVGIQTDL